MAEQAAQTVRGQVEEIELLRNQEICEEPYFRSIQGKTGGFFALPTEGAALIAGFSEEESKLIGTHFLELGTLFQLQDDVLDLYGNKGRGHVGSDILEGKPSLLVLRHLELFPQDTSYVWDILSKPRIDTTQEEVMDLIHRFKEGGALERALNDIRMSRSRLFAPSVLNRYPILERILHTLVDKILSPISSLL